MILSPPVLALNGVALTTTLLMLLASRFAFRILRHWEIGSGSELQVSLERRTYLISTLVFWCFAAELLSLLLFIYNAERMSSQFVGAMCATGVLNAAPWGWTALFLKIALFFAGTAWLMLNRVDNQAPDYPLVRVKYGLLLALLPLVATQALVQLQFFRGLDPDVITSCCGSLFTPAGEGAAAEVSSLDPGLSLATMYGTGAATLTVGVLLLRRQRAMIGFSLLAATAFASALAAVVSAVALYVYEHPHHHCPFCILKSGHGFVGYWLYIPLFAATALALGTGLVSLWHRVPSLRAPILADGRRFTAVSLGLMAVFYALSSWSVLTSNLTMEGVWW